MNPIIEEFTKDEFQMSPAEFENVAESFPIYDSMILCPVMYGQESNIVDWYTTFPAFAANTEHSFFKSRTEATAGLAYCNKQTVDSMDYAFLAYSFGVSFWAPGVRTLAMDSLPDSSMDTFNSQIAHWWEVELPRHCSIEFKVQQDTILKLPCMAASPGYGPTGGGTSFNHEQCGALGPNGVDNGGYFPVLNMAVTQGAPYLKNRFPFTDPIGIPRTSSVEAIVKVSDIGRYYLDNVAGAPYYFFNEEGGSGSYGKFPARFGITVSVFGKRLVQQRGQYHR